MRTLIVMLLVLVGCEQTSYKPYGVEEPKPATPADICESVGGTECFDNTLNPHATTGLDASIKFGGEFICRVTIYEVPSREDGEKLQLEDERANGRWAQSAKSKSGKLVAHVTYDDGCDRVADKVDKMMSAVSAAQ